MINTHYQHPISNPDTLVQQLANAEEEAKTLRVETEQLKANISALSLEKERLILENRLAIQDAELARSFKRNNYAPMIETLIEQPLKALCRQILVATVFAITAVTAAAYFLSNNSHTHTLSNNAIKGDTTTYHHRINNESHTILIT